VVIGSFARRQQLVERVNDVLATLTIAPLDATANSTPSSTTTRPTSTSAPTTDAPTTTIEPTTTLEPTTTTPAGSGGEAP
jgi:hypothetical protein